MGSDEGKEKRRRTSYKKKYLDFRDKFRGKEKQLLKIQKELSSLRKKFEEQQKELESIDKEADQYLDYLKRLKAEFDNYKKRNLKEQGRKITLFSEDLIKQFLPIVDDLERALETVRGKEDITNFVQGVEIIFNQLKSTLEKQGLEQIRAKGEPFDPYLHEAIMKVELDEYPDNIIVEEMRKGYKLKDRVLRPTMVKVNKRGDKDSKR
jgi:molecular chaperone GrpE